ncbi:MAG: UDP-glucose/GDP-mannose dehydrogenase family protein, partial [Myxococcota bacterium]|nr:UDP-glucose/GDP-mannose dehydrogenase family protein [Myxococcota bacterium]
IGMIGTGYVGLVTGAGLAETGANVECADVDTAKIERLRAGEMPLFEPGLEPLVHRNVEAGRLSFTDDVAGAIARSDVVFVAVGTPQRFDGAASLLAVDRVAETVARVASRRTLLVLKSTVPVGTHARVRRIVSEARAPIHVVSNPEFLKEGEAVTDFFRPDRIVVGVEPDDEHARAVMRRIYHPLCLNRDHILWMTPASAELTKYVANAMLAMRVSFMNEIAALCERVGADVHQVRQGVGADPRIGPKFLYAGPGYGGSCLPKDVKALVHTARELGLELELAAATDRVNERQRNVLARKLRARFEGDLRRRRIGVWGLSFKPRTDDIRESPALSLIDALLEEGAEVAAHDPAAMDNARARYGERVTLCPDAYDVARDADALVLVTEWREYQNPDFERLASLMRRRLLLDGRNVWSSYGLRAMGFEYDGIGVLGS